MRDTLGIFLSRRGEAEDTWPRVLEDAAAGRLERFYRSIPLLYGPGTMRYRPVDEVVREVAQSPTRAVVFWDDNIGANPRYSKELFRALAPLGKWWTSQCTATAAKDEEFQRPAAASGCKALFMGFESATRSARSRAG